MTDPWLEEWLEKAEEDFRAASSLDPESTPGAICFHCQQCIEKYLKASLAAVGMDPPRTHDLIALNDDLRRADAGFAILAQRLQVLTPYSVPVRYPGVGAAPDDARQAVETMHELRAQIRQLLELEPEQ